ncbi:hypothetical protein COLO4_33177 [Corchorus olitorius]|uniref:Uncharacterized protein n=1 Tax=Corchorus olitorius TaxID=93759 RepID=A0A1R3GVY5_9ROSI|nr:hypothetical protein COLO4_33177 [Corchorus olitorius]
MNLKISISSTRLLANAILDDPFNALISQHRIPLHSFNHIYTSFLGDPTSSSKAFLTQKSQKSFIEITSDSPYLHKPIRCSRGRLVAAGNTVQAI